MTSEPPDDDEVDPPNVVPFRPASDGDGQRPCPTEWLVAGVEACLFATPGVVSMDQLTAALRSPEAHVAGALAALGERLAQGGSGLRLAQIGTGWQLRTEARLAPWVAAIRGGKPFRLTRAANETLAIVAFRQPVTKGVLDDIRGVDCGGVVRMLVDRGLIRSDGRADEPGRPLVWVTTPAFLELFGLRSLADLPTLRDLRSLGDEEEAAFGTVPEPSSDQVERMARLLHPRPHPVEDA